MLVAIVAVAGTASAESTTRVFPLTGALTGELADAPAAVTRALANALGAEVASVPLDDAAGVLDCDPETVPCLESVANSLGATRLVAGTVTLGSGKVAVTIVRFEAGKRDQRTFLLDGARGLPDALVRAAGPMLGLRAPADRVVVTEDGATAPPSQPPPVDTGVRERRGASAGTWLLVGGGLFVAGIGTGSLISARNLRDDIASAPTATRADFERLVDLEDRERTRTQLGIALLAAGGAVTVVGVVRAIVQRSSSRDDSVTIAPHPLAGGAGVIPSWRFP